jgi:hypothetical protein
MVDIECLQAGIRKDFRAMTPLSMRCANTLAALAIATFVAGPGSAMSDGRGSGLGAGSHQRDFQSEVRANGARRSAEVRRAASNDGARRNAHANAFHSVADDAMGLHGLAGPHDGDRSHGGFVHDGEPWRNEAFSDHRWIAPFLGQVPESGPIGFLFAPRYYGDGDFQYCMRRDVYGDLYQAC